MQSIKTLLVLASEQRARFFENTGVGKGLAEVEDVGRSALDMDRATPADREGRVAAGGGARHGFEPRSLPDDQLRHAFTAEVMAAITARATDAPFDRLVIAAPPRMLGLLRAALPHDLRKRLVFDLDKDLIDVAAADLPAHFAAHAVF
ncbi:MAG: hypothetical protein GC186_14025 [Rhodobacteraceae bacterium]|nr:hypothetical protein [Paracoccaceae bacterium]